MASSENENEDLKAATALSLAPLDTVSREQPVACVQGKTHENGSTAISKAPIGLAGLDRRAMEQERLARLASRKRKASISPPPMRKAPKLDDSVSVMPSGALLRDLSTMVQRDQRDRKPPAANAANENLKNVGSLGFGDATAASISTSGTAQSNGLSSSLKYPHGVVKKTWAFGFERDGHDVKLEEVLEASTLCSAVLSAFQWDIEWLLPKLKTPAHGGTTKCVFVMQAKTEAERQAMLSISRDAQSFLRLCFPPMGGQINCMHSKLMLLFHAEKLRVVLPTANLLNFDWGETGQMANSVFMIDLPRLLGDKNTAAEELSSFGKELLYFIGKQGLDQDVKDELLAFDFSATKHMAFVHTVGGTSLEAQAARTGLPGLSQAVRSLGLRADDLEIDFAASSIGALRDDYLESMHAAGKGLDPFADQTAAHAKAKSDFFSPAPANRPKSKPSIRDKFRIYFPTADTVGSSIARAAGTICLSRKYFEDMSFPRSCFRDYRSVRSGLLSHNKILYARGRRKSSDGKEQDVAWVYVGSANMSSSAWGRVSFDKKTKQWKTNCRNWECGVLLPVPAAKLVGGNGNGDKKKNVEGDDAETESEDEGDREHPAKQLVGMDAFEGFVDLPFEYPGATYDGREPWYFQEERQM